MRCCSGGGRLLQRYGPQCGGTNGVLVSPCLIEIDNPITGSTTMPFFIPQENKMVCGTKLVLNFDFSVVVEVLH